MDVGVTDLEHSRRDVVFTFATDSWADAVSRDHCMPGDQLVLHLAGSKRVGRLMVADPWRSAPVRAVRRLQGSSGVPLVQDGDGGRHIRPLRLRRFDPVRLPALRRAYERYDRWMQRAASRAGLVQPAIITCNPFVAAYSPLEWAGPVTLYLWDDWAAHPSSRKWWSAYEDAYRVVGASGRRLVTVSQRLIDRVNPTGPSEVIPNGVSPEEWTPPWDVPGWFAEMPKPRAVYIGTLDDRLDTAALVDVAARWPSGSVVLAGPQVASSVLARLDRVPNVVIRPPIGRTEVAAVVSASDVCLLAHRTTALTCAMSPLKLYEYLAGGARVVATDLPPVRDVDPSVLLVEPGGAFAEAVAQALARPRPSEETRKAFVEANSWTSRHEAFLDLALGD
jgi:teichuronic acid biosynthesis glycosyltransferase TuaH